MTTNTPRSGNRETATYSAPALEKGLDILELFADQGDHGLTQTQIADQLGRSQGELYRMLACLVQRGYVSRGPDDDNYRLTAKLFELAHRHPPTRRLTDAALPAMRAFAQRAEQSCHLAVRREQMGIVVAHVDSSSFVGVSVRPGAMLPLDQSVSGRVLMAFELHDLRESWLVEMKRQLKPKAYAALAEQIENIRIKGFDRSPSTRADGILDLSVPVLNHDGYAVAALSVPCLLPKHKHVDTERVLKLQQEAAVTIQMAIGAGQSGLDTPEP
ncbi:MAG: IclR family transcriptional regulator [Planctomycetota bacterium]